MPVTLKIIVDDDGTVALKKLGDGAKKAGDGLDGAGKKGKKAFDGISRSLKTGILGLASFTAGVMAIRSSMKVITGFETAMAEVSTIVDTSVVSMKQLNAQIVDLTTKVPQDAQQLAKGLYQTISAGILNTADALIVLESASRAATAGLTDTFTAVDVGTTIINAYGFEVNEINRVNDVLFNTVKEGKTTFTQLAGALGRAAPIAAQVGISFEELTAATATLTKGGISTDESMTAIRAIMLGVLKPTQDAMLMAEKLKIEFTSQALSAKGLSKFLQDVKEKTGGNADAMTALFGNVRALTGVFALAGKQSEEFAKILKSNENAAGAADEAFKKMNETTEAQWKLFKNQLTAGLLGVGQTVLPILNAGLKTFSNLMTDNTTILRTNQIEFNALLDVLKDTNIAQDTRERTIAALQGQYPDYIKNINLEKAGIEEISKLQDEVNKSILERIQLESAREKTKEFTDLITDSYVKLFEAELDLKKATKELSPELKTMTEFTMLGGVAAIGQATSYKALEDRIADYKAEIIKTQEEQKKFLEGLKELGVNIGLLSGGKTKKPKPVINEVVPNTTKVATETKKVSTLWLDINASGLMFGKGMQAYADQLNAVVEKQSVWNWLTKDTNANMWNIVGALTEIGNMTKSGVSLSGLFRLAAGISTIIPGAQGLTPFLAGGGQVASSFGFAKGGSFTVPGSGSGDRPYMVNLTPGEQVDVTPKGGGGGGGVNINLSLSVGGGDRKAIQASANKHLSNLAEDVKAIIKNRNLRKTDLAKAV